MYLSIIIPSFNGETRLEKSVKSVLTALQCIAFLHNETEIIIIDDGSQDATLKIAESLAARNPIISVSRQKNAGVSAARNHGLQVATGNWICFVDDDDTITKDAFLRFSQAKTDADIVILKSQCNNIERYPWKDHFNVGIPYEKDDLMKEGYLRGSICGCIFRRSFLLENKLQFPEGVSLGEDTVLFSESISYAKSITFLDIDYYNITPRTDSASRKYDKNDIYMISKAMEKAKNSIPSASILNYTLFKLAINLTSKAVDNHIPLGEAKKLLKAFLPLQLDGIYTERGKIMLLNACYPIFYTLIGLRNRARN